MVSGSSMRAVSLILFQIFHQFIDPFPGHICRFQIADQSGDGTAVVRSGGVFDGLLLLGDPGAFFKGQYFHSIFVQYLLQDFPELIQKSVPGGVQIGGQGVEIVL